MKSVEENYYRYREWYKAGGVKKVIAIRLFFIKNLICGSDIPLELELGERCKFGHRGIGVVIHKDCIIGNDVHIMQNVTIGGKNGGTPIIGDNVFIGAGAVILGAVRIGDNAQIGANACVIKDVPINAVVGGVPAKILRMNS